MTPLEASRRMYECVRQGDWKAVEAFMADDLVIREPASLPYGGEWRGKDALQRLYAHVMSFWDEPRVEWIDLIGGDGHTVALLRFTMTARATGTRVTQTVCEVTRFAEGKMAEMQIHYFDTAALLKALEG
jgi:ketosteroid isomerase-like protein